MDDHRDLGSILDPHIRSSLLPVIQKLTEQQHEVHRALGAHVKTITDLTERMDLRRLFTQFTTSFASLGDVVREVQVLPKSITFDIPDWTLNLNEDFRVNIDLARQLAPAIRALESLQHYRALALDVSQLRIDIGALLPRMSDLHDALVRAVEVRAAIGNRWISAEKPSRRLVSSFDKLSRAASDVWRGTSESLETWLEWPETVRDMPAIGLIQAARATGAVFGVDEELRESSDFDEVLVLREDDIHARLSMLGPAFVDRYAGALDAMRRGGPDWFRHASASLRELLLDILNRYAPDDAVTSGEKPTRRQKIAYLLRRFSPKFQEFFVKDETHIQETIRLLNIGVHEPAPPFGESLQRNVVFRSQYALWVLLLAAEGE